MKTIYVYNDIHLFGVHALSGIDITFNDNDYHIGDVIDMKGCKKKLVDVAQAYMDSIKRKSKHYCSGNHELDLDPETFYHVDNKVLFTHGDYLVYGEEAADEWRSKTPGRGKWMRLALRIIYPFRKLKKLKISQAFKERCAAKAKEVSCNTIVMGHRHPSKLISIMHDGIRIMILPRGKNTLQIEQKTMGLIEFNEIRHIKSETE